MIAHCWITRVCLDFSEHRKWWSFNLNVQAQSTYLWYEVEALNVLYTCFMPQTEHSENEKGK